MYSCDTGANNQATAQAVSIKHRCIVFHKYCDAGFGDTSTIQSIYGATGRNGLGANDVDADRCVDDCAWACLLSNEFCDDDIHDIVGGCAADVPVAGGDNNEAMENVR